MFRDVVRGKDRFVIIPESGEVASWAFSVRENDASVEDAAEMLPRFRSRDLAKAAVSAWAHAVITSGKVAFFSHSYDNIASEALAES
ncbi:MAG: hypothetical protein GWN14_15640 [candidate division Zixibacteria bacterium]|nr:hypothetical protein [candidate division Zixibacteria bacterium]